MPTTLPEGDGDLAGRLDLAQDLHLELGEGLLLESSPLDERWNSERHSVHRHGVRVQLAKCCSGLVVPGQRLGPQPGEALEQVRHASGS